MVSNGSLKFYDYIVYINDKLQTQFRTFHVGWPSLSIKDLLLVGAFSI